MCNAVRDANLIVGVGRREAVGEAAGALKHLAGIVRTVHHIGLGGKGLRVISTQDSIIDEGW